MQGLCGMEWDILAPTLHYLRKTDDLTPTSEICYR
jgi:hypothetical protein